MQNYYSQEKEVEISCIILRSEQYSESEWVFCSRSISSMYQERRRHYWDIPGLYGSGNQTLSEDFVENSELIVRFYKNELKKHEYAFFWFYYYLLLTNILSGNKKNFSKLLRSGTCANISYTLPKYFSWRFNIISCANFQIDCRLKTVSSKKWFEIILPCII